MKADLYLKNARVITEEEEFRGGVVIQGEKIAQLVHGAGPIEAKQTVDLGGKVLLPGVVDAHVHLNEPGRTHWEGYCTGTMAAAAGGSTTLLDMPLNSIPYTINHEALTIKRKAAADQAVVDYGQWGGFVDNNLEDLEALNNDGVVAFKAFASNSGVEFERVDDDLLYAGLTKIHELGNLIGLHAENEAVTSYLGRQMRAAGRTDRAAWYESRPPETEFEAIQRSCYWAKTTGGNLHIVHISVPEGVRAIARLRDEGVHVTAETCPHYLFFDHQAFEQIGPAAKCAPPIRSRECVEGLWQCVFEGLVDTIGSDHSPCTWEEKANGLEDIWKAWGGISGVQMTLTVMISEGVNKRGLPLTMLVKLLAANPARLFGLYPRKGNLNPGADADLVVVDLDKKWTLTADQLFNKNKFSAYVGSSFTGCVERTMVRGKTVFQDGQILVNPGYGQLQRRSYKYAY